MNSFLTGTIFKFRINLLEKGSFCCLQMCKLPLRRTTVPGQDPALHLQPNQDPNISWPKLFTTTHHSCRVYAGESHRSIDEAPALPHQESCLFFFFFFNVLTGSTPSHVSQQTPKHSDYFWKHCCSYHCDRSRTAVWGWGRKKQKRCSKHIDTVRDLTSEVKPLYAGLSEVPVWTHCSGLRGLWEKTSNSTTQWMQISNLWTKPWATARQRENLLAASILYPVSNKATQMFG